ncbi:MAG: hypothetical protein ACO1PN_09720 [Betaproteobacteria bacterium]
MSPLLLISTYKFSWFDIGDAQADRMAVFLRLDAGDFLQATVFT